MQTFDQIWSSLMNFMFTNDSDVIVDIKLTSQNKSEIK